MRFAYLLLFIAISTQYSCANKQMKKLHSMHAETLQGLLGDQIKAEDKIEGLADTYIQLFEEALTINSSKKAYQHISKFSKSNKRVLELLVSQIEGQMADMSFEEKASYFLSLTQKDYLPKLMKLIPQVEKKINSKLKSFSIISKLLKLFKPESLIDSLLK